MSMETLQEESRLEAYVRREFEPQIRQAASEAD
jgi:hypothetical protein